MNGVRLYASEAKADFNAVGPIYAAINTFFKWFFDVTKNFLALVAIQLAAEKTHSDLILMFSIFSQGVFDIYILNIAYRLLISLFHWLKNHQGYMIAFFVVLLPTVTYANYQMQSYIFSIVKFLVVVQSSPK